MDVEEWLKGLGLGQYAPAFAENDIDFAVLAQLTEVDLKLIPRMKKMEVKRAEILAAPGRFLMIFRGWMYELKGARHSRLGRWRNQAALRDW
jgi:hypothetical protein